MMVGPETSVLETETNPRRIIYATDFPRHPNCAECAAAPAIREPLLSCLGQQPTIWFLRPPVPCC